MDIEEVAHKTPEKIVTIHIDPATGYSQFHGRQVAFALGLKDGQIRQCVNLIGNLYRAFTEKDMSLLEINPLIVTAEGRSRLPGRETELRRQRPLPAPRHSEPARSGRGRPGGGFGVPLRPFLCEAGRQYRLPRQWRGTGHGHDGHHQALRLRACELPRRGRRRDEGEGNRGLQDHSVRPEREGHSRQHLRRHHALRHHRGRALSRRRARRASRCRSW